MHSVAEYQGSLCHTLENIMQLAFGKEMQRAVGYSVKLLFLKLLNTASGKCSRDKLYNLSFYTQIKLSAFEPQAKIVSCLAGENHDSRDDSKLQKQHQKHFSRSNQKNDKFCIEEIILSQ